MPPMPAADHLPDPYPIAPRGPLRAELRPPGSRSITNRALICAALAPPGSRLLGATENDDTLAMREGLVRLGVPIRVEAGDWHVDGGAGRLPGGGDPGREVQVDVRASGTTARFLTAAACLARGPAILDGTARMRERPIRDLVDALRGLGAGVEILGRDGCPPVRTAGGGIPGGRTEIDVSRSSQYVSGVLLSAPCANAEIELIFSSESLVSRPFLELTCQVMRDFGGAVELSDEGARVAPGGYRSTQFEVEPDAQSAVYGFCAAAIAGGRVRVLGIPDHSQQTDLGLLSVLEKMGCGVRRERTAVVVEAPDAGLRGVDVDMNDIPDAVLALAVVALFAEGPTLIRNIANLRIKETDRLHALETELRRLGAGAEAGPDFLRIEPRALRGATIETYDDHRMAMSFALAGLRIPGVEIRDPACVSKSWPDFFDSFEQW